jgi:L-xylulokinase
MAKYLLGIDNGGTVTKAGLFDLAGNELAVEGRRTEMTSPAPGFTERDTEELWQATAAAIRQVLDRSGIDPGDIACIATAGHGNGLYLVDREGTPVRPGIISTDTRAADYVARWRQQGVTEAILPKTMQSLWPAQPPALLAWLKDNEPDVIARAGWVLMAKDFIRSRLIGQFHAELSDTSGSSLIDVGTGDYDDALFEAYGLADLRHLMPPIARSEEICGHVTEQAAAATGLAPGTPVAGGLFDADACSLAGGMVDESVLQVIAGTWSVNQYITRQPVIDPNIFMTSRYCVPGYYLIMEASATSASNLEWFTGQVLGPEAEALAARGESIFDACNREVAAIPADQCNLIFLPFLFGSNANPAAKSCLLGLGGWHRRGHVLRAIYEGVLMSHRWHIDRLMRFRDRPDFIRLAGGAARSEVWSRMFADVFQVPVEIPAGTELGALGSAILAAVAAGCYDDFPSAVDAMVRIEAVRQPDPAMAGVYDQKYQRYLKALDALEPLWSEL